MSQRRRAPDVPARLDGAHMPTRTVLWEATDTLQCINCDGPISRGDLFTRGKYPGGGHAHGDFCRACRPFTVLTSEISSRRPQPVETPSVPALTGTFSTVIDPDAARELSRAAKQATSWTERRNTLIREAVANGAGIREVARVVGLSHPSVLNIVKPRQR